MRPLRLALSIIVVSFSSFLASADSGRIWVTESTADFAAGEIRGVRLEADGGVSPALERWELSRLRDESILLSAIRTADGDLVIGTGFRGKVYRVPAEGGSKQLLGTIEETAVFALAESPGGTVYAAGSPGGRIYRLEDGEAKLVHETGETYVWGLHALDEKTLLAATGDEGKLLEITGKGTKRKQRILVDSSAANLRQVVVGPDGAIYAGSDSEGLVYRVGTDGTATVVASSSAGEISGLIPDGDSLWILGTGGEVGKSVGTKAKGDAKKGDRAAEATPSTGGSVSVEATAASDADDVSGGFEVLRLRADGVVEEVASDATSVGYAMTRARDGRIWIGAGPKGLLLTLEDGELLKAGEIPEKTPFVVLPGGAGVIVGSADGPAIYRFGPNPDPAATYLSKVHAEKRQSRWGAYSWQGSPGDGRVRLYFRSGGPSTPDDSWSEWVEVDGWDGQIPSPVARHLQWKAVLETGGERAPFLRSVTAHSSSSNLPPKIRRLTVHPPGEVWIQGAYSPGNVVVEASNPDREGIFTVVDAAREKGKGKGKKVFRRGYRTITWDAKDPNDDPLTFGLEFQVTGRSGRGQGGWYPVAEDLFNKSSFAFDSSTLPDGYYLFRLGVTDERGNPLGAAFTDDRTSNPVVVDNTPPTVSIESSVEGQSVRVKARYTDLLSPMLRAEYAVDAGSWIQVRPVDGNADQVLEEIEFVAEGADGPPELVILRLLDRSFNVTTRSVLGR